MTSQIEHEVQKRTLGRIRDLRVQFIGRKVVIHGRSATYYAKQLAQHGVLDVLPTAEVENAIEVN